MKRTLLYALLVLIIALVGCSTPFGPAPTPALPDGAGLQPKGAVVLKSPTPVVTATPPTVDPTANASDSPMPSASPSRTEVPPATAPDPFDLISLENLLAVLEDLTAIQPYSGWRNSASEGEAQALDYVAERLGELKYLQALGLELERQSFHVFLATELWDTGLSLAIGGQEIQVPVEGLRGDRDNIAQALRFDSDGVLNDSAPNPMVIEGEALPIGSSDDLQALKPNDVQGKVVFLDYALVDRSVMDTQEAVAIASELVQKRPAGIVLVTANSNKLGESHGAFVGDVSAFNWVEARPAPPVLHVRLEDMAPAGIEGWDDLKHIEVARLTWDADVFSPGTSGNLVARIPGIDPSQAMILGAHIDSPNAPGAMDDGSGSVILLEVARVLDAAQLQPPTDLYLAWFGSEELGLYGGSHFVASHQELLDRTRAVLQIDCLSRPLDDVSAELRLVTWPYGRLGDPRMVWPEALAEAAAAQGIEAVPFDAYYTYSDDSTFGGFDVPHADLIYEPVVDPDASIHYAGHLHDPYDTIDVAREQGDVLQQMARVALAAALDTFQGNTLRVTPRPDRRALFVGSHTEALMMSPVGFTEMGMALAMEGLDVDLVPYGQAVTSADLEDADLVVALPVHDFPTPGGDLDLYDEAWTQPEIDALEAYVAEGGLLVLTTSRQRLKYGLQLLDTNEDWADANALASRFGITYQEGAMTGHQARTERDHPLVKGVSMLEFGEENAAPFALAEGVDGQVLARAGGDPAAVLLEYGDAGGQVLVLTDVGMLGAGWSEPRNLPFWQNLARYARSR
jgi:hypothetical protein